MWTGQGGWRAPAARLCVLGLSVLALTLSGCGHSGSVATRVSRVAASTPATSAATTSDTPTVATTLATSTVAATPAAPAAPPPPTAPATSNTPAAAPPAPTTTAAPADCDTTSGFDCAWQARFQAADAYAASRPGTVGIVITDRQTGATWSNKYAGTSVYTASTIKLAMTVDLLQRNDSGQITLTGDDRSLISAMLHSSDDDAADTLWYRYSGPNDETFNQDFAALGMSGLTPVLGPEDEYSPYWGFQTCTPRDLSTLINYVLNTLNAADRAWIVPQMQSVDVDQQWGVWGAGPAAAPGNKDGWSDEAPGWVINSVGFVGPGQRYTIAMMNNLVGEGGYDDGTQTLSQISQIIFGGAF